MKLRFILHLLACMAFAGSNAQGKGENDYLHFYPIGQGSNLCYKTSYVKSETILFEANPLVRYSFANNIKKGLANDSDHVRAWYISVRPQWRMYTDNSLPVKMPTNIALLGTQHLWRHKKKNFLAVSLETGHYSNGQSGCAFAEGIEDGTAKCDSVYNLITDQTDLSRMLNRRNGNYSTNLTEVIANYRFNTLDDDEVPKAVHSISAGATFYHDKLFIFLFDIGGYSDADIKIYGRVRYHLGYERIKNFSEGRRWSFAENIELIQKPHDSVNPFRSETIFTVYPHPLAKAFGYFLAYTFGHDNYNFRFVDSGHQVTFGITWTGFPPFAIGSGKPE
jgi:hypothetical protein